MMLYVVKPSEIDSDLSFKRRGLCILAICARAHGCYLSSRKAYLGAKNVK